MEDKIYKATRNTNFGTRKALLIFGATILFLATAFSATLASDNTESFSFFPFLIIIFISLGLISSIFSQVNVWVEGNNLIVENKYKKEKRERISLVSGLKLETEKKLRTSNKGTVDLYNYLLHIKYGSGEEKKITLTFTKKQDRTSLCQDIASASSIDISDLDLSENAHKVGSISDIINIFKQAKSKTSGDITSQSAPESEIQKTDYKQQTNISVSKPGNTNFDVSGLLRAVFAVVVVGVVIYYMLVIR